MLTLLKAGLALALIAVASGANAGSSLTHLNGSPMIDDTVESRMANPGEAFTPSRADPIRLLKAGEAQINPYQMACSLTDDYDPDGHQYMAFTNSGAVVIPGGWFEFTLSCGYTHKYKGPWALQPGDIFLIELPDGVSPEGFGCSAHVITT
jgi:hypothetical protein